MLRIVCLRTAFGLAAFGGFIVLIAPYAMAPVTAIGAISVAGAGMLYATSHGLSVVFPRLAAVVLLALSVHELLPLPVALWILAPMILVGLGSDYLLPYPKEKKEGKDGKPDDVRALAPQEAEKRRTDDA